MAQMKRKQARTGPSRCHIQGSKIAKDFQVSIYSTRKSKSQKNGPSGALGPANASPWRAKEKKKEKKYHNAEKLKGGPFGVFQRPYGRKTSKN